MIILVASSIGCLALLILYATLRTKRVRRARAAALVPISVGSWEVPLPHAVWGLCAVGGTEFVTDTLSRSKARTAADLHKDVEDAISGLPEKDRFRLEQRAAEIERRQAERVAWQTHADMTSAAAGIGALDGMLLVLGQNSEWLASAVSATPIHDGMAAGLQGLLEHKLSLPLIEEVAPEAAASISAWLGDYVAEPIVSGVVSLGDGAAEVLGGAADVGIPIATTLLAVKKAVSSSNAGLESGRVAENFAWDLGAKGGGVATGAAIGTALFPGIGTVLGGLIGGFVGNGIANEGKLETPPQCPAVRRDRPLRTRRRHHARSMAVRRPRLRQIPIRGATGICPTS